RTDARGDGGPDPDRDLRFLVPVLHLRHLGPDPAAVRRQDPADQEDPGLRRADRVPVHGGEVPGLMAARTDDARVLRLGVITLVMMALVSAATFNLSKFPGFRG